MSGNTPRKAPRLQTLLTAALVAVPITGLVVNKYSRCQAQRARDILNDARDEAKDLPDIGDAGSTDTAYEPAEGEEGQTPEDEFGSKDPASVDVTAEWMQDPDWVAAQNELDAALSHVSAHFKELRLELDSLEEGDLLPDWVKSANCDTYFVTLKSIGAAPAVNAQSDEVPVDDRWKFEYGDPSFPEIGGTSYFLNYFPPSDSELGADLNASLNPLNSNTTTDDVPCEAGEEGVVLNVSTQSRDGGNKYRAAGDFCAPGTEEVIEKTQIPVVEQQARDLCDGAKAVRGY